MRLINWDRFGQFLTEPQQIANDVYHWNSDFDSDKFLTRLERLMRAAVLPGGLYPQADTTRAVLGNTSTDLQELRVPIFQKGFIPDTYSQFGITFSPAEAQGTKKEGIALLPYIMGTSEFQFAVCDRGELIFESTADIKSVGLVIRPPFDAEGILNLTGAFRAAVQIREKPERAEEIILIGSRGGTRLAIQGLGISWFAQNPQGKLDLGLEAELQALRLVIAPGEGDGFLAKILSGLHVEAEANLAIGITLLSGFTFSGGAKLALELPLHVDLGPVKIDGLRLALAPTDDQLDLEVGAVFKFDLGPLKAIVENIGLKSVLQFRQGNLGPANLDMAFKPPNGVGLSLDVGAIKGGGLLRFDPERKEYFGYLEFVFSGFINLKAIGLLTTRMPDGSDGFSLLIIITAKFGTGIQLGFGFTLLEVGGLIGLNRTVKLPVLIDGVRTGAINSIMFPENLVANAPRIISDLRAFFPPEEGKFLIGPMARIAWGTPPLITISLGVIIEIPGNITIVGVLRMVLPDDKAALLVLQVNFVGAIEFDKKRFFLFAALFESSVLSTPIGGEMGVLMAFGPDANFIVTVGGFHPRYNPPPLPFPTPRRISLDILNTTGALIRLEGYFALTTNTAQFGARAELRFGFDDFGIQGHLGFDALLQFSPFHFIVEIKASVSLKAFGVGTFSIRLRFTLEGPTPYRARGTGSLSIFWVIDISVDFDETWGESRNTTLPPIDVLPRLKTEFEKNENWRAQLPAGSNLLVTLRKLDPATELVLHPVGTLRVSQRLAPLDLGIDRVGNQKVDDVSKVSVQMKNADDVLGKKGDTRESFARGQYQNLDDAKRLSQAAYEEFHSGLEISVKGESLQTSRMVKRVVRYEQIVIDNNFKRFRRPLFVFHGGLFTHFLKGASVSKSVLSQAHLLKFDPFAEKIEIKPEGFVVAYQANNVAFNLQATFASEAEAQDYLGQQTRLDPNMGDTLHVIPRFEVAQ